MEMLVDYMALELNRDMMKRTSVKGVAEVTSILASFIQPTSYPRACVHSEGQDSASVFMGLIGKVTEH